MGFWSSLGRWFSALGSFLRPAFDAIVANGGMILVDAAREAVAAVEANPSLLAAKGGGKRDAAATIILARMKSRGIRAATSAINLAIEAAVAALPKK